MNICDKTIKASAYFMKQNITLTIDKSLIKKKQNHSGPRETSVNKMLSDELKRLVQSAKQYEFAKRKALANLKAGFHFGGKITRSKKRHFMKDKVCFSSFLGFSDCCDSVSVKCREDSHGRFE